MQKNTILTSFRWMMIVLNVTIITFLSLLFYITPQRAVYRAEAMRFAERLEYLPPRPWTQVFALAGMVALIVVSMIYRHRAKKQLKEDKIVYWLEPLICMLVIFTIHLDYNGLLFLVVVDLVETLHGKFRTIFLSFLIAFYLLTSLDIVQSALHVTSVADYMTYYSAHTRNLMQSTLGLFSAFNMILFIGYVLLLVIQRTEENTAIRRLNGELEQANDKLSVLNEQLKAYAAESERMAETRERNRLAREIHDTLGHALTGITAGADACITMLDISPGMARKQMEQIAATARQGMSEVRRSVNALRPDALERLQLSEALSKLCAEMEATSHASIGLHLESRELRLSPDEEDAVYRIIQESITNAIRHGQATKVDITISCEQRRMKICVQDNGMGCTIINPGFGLRHMRERLNLLNGTLEINGKNGFRIEAVIPLRWGDEV